MIPGDFKRWNATSTKGNTEKVMLKMLGQRTVVKSNI